MKRSECAVFKQTHNTFTKRRRFDFPVIKILQEAPVCFYRLVKAIGVKSQDKASAPRFPSDIANHLKHVFVKDIA
jgi:hypothetical protein